jgi:hypothetical protein
LLELELNGPSLATLQLEALKPCTIIRNSCAITSSE